nr:MAG TPA: tail assembly chaperone protein [Caudoviricetes sp.]
MQKYILKSGKIVELNLAPVETALELYRSVIQECRHCNFDLAINDDMTMLELVAKNSSPLLAVMGSETVMEAIKSCCAKVLYDKQRFSMELFEDEKARGDFFGVMILVALENLIPFFPQARSLSTTLLSPFLT